MSAQRKIEGATVVALNCSTLPAPLVPNNCKVGSDYMPLYGEKLFNSTFWTEAPLAAKVAALQLWYEAWTGEVASRLPNSDKRLAHIAGYGKDLRGWHRIRQWAMHGFILCSDNNYYHPVQAQAAMEILSKRIKDRNRKRAAAGNQEAEPGTEPAAARGQNAQDGGKNAAKAPQEYGKTAGNLQPDSVANQGVSGTLPLDGLGHTIGNDSKGTLTPSGVRGGEAATGGKPPLTADEIRLKATWDEGKALVAKLAPGITAKERGGLVGSLVKALGGGTKGGIRAIQKLRDVEVMILCHELPGYDIADSDEGRAAAVQSYCYGIAGSAKGDAKAQKGLGGKTPRGHNAPNAGKAFEDMTPAEQLMANQGA